MLKIYHAYANDGETKIEDKIDFEQGYYDTGLYGFGRVNSGDLNVSRANYNIQSLYSFREYIKTVKVENGYVDKFVIVNPVTYRILEDRFKDIPEDFDTYLKYGLVEEGIILFTNYVSLLHPNDNSVQKVFGRNQENGMYLIMPNASFSIIRQTFDGDITENYEVLQSKRAGRQLALTKMNR